MCTKAKKTHTAVGVCLWLGCDGELCAESVADALDDVNAGAVVALLYVGEVGGSDAGLLCEAPHGDAFGASDGSEPLA